LRLAPIRPSKMPPSLGSSALAFGSLFSAPP